MAHCYLLALAQGSALDQYGGNWSLFGLTERLQIPADLPAAGEIVVPFEIHAHWEFSPEELGAKFEWRFLLTTGDETRFSKTYQLESTKRFHRHRIRGFPLLLEGETRLMAEWRVQDAEWTRCGVYWPLTLERQPKPPPPAAANQGGA